MRRKRRTCHEWVNEKSVKRTEKNLQDDESKVHFMGLKTKLHDNFCLGDFHSRL